MALMKIDDKVEMLITLLGVEQSEQLTNTLEVYLDAASREIINWRYSYAESKPDEVPEEYEMTQVYAVIAGYSTSGAENQTSHSENGISRVFKYEDMIAYIRGHVIPIARCI